MHRRSKGFTSINDVTRERKRQDLVRIETRAMIRAPVTTRMRLKALGAEVGLQRQERAFKANRPKPAPFAPRVILRRKAGA